MRLLKSEFTYRAFAIPVITAAFTSIVIFMYINEDFGSFWMDIFMGFAFTLTIFKLVYVELRQKIIVVQINDNRISKRNYLGQTEEFDFRDFEGYETSTISFNSGTFEYLYLVQNDKKRIKVSEQYHRNYNELKTAIKERTKFLGDNSNFWNNLKNSFLS